MSNNFVINMKQQGEKSKHFREIIKRITQKSYPIYINAGHSSFLSYIFFMIGENVDCPIIIVFNTEDEAKRALDDLKNFDFPRFFLPCFSPLSYQGIPTPDFILAQRSFTLHQLAKKTRGLYLTSLEAILWPIPSLDSFVINSFTLKENDSLSPQKIAKKLTDLGFRQVAYPSSLGDFSLKGSILDIFSYPECYRVYFDFDILTQIKSLNILQNTTGKKLSEITLTPLKEKLWNTKSLENIENKFPHLKENSPWFWENLIHTKQTKSQELYFGASEKKLDYLSAIFSDSLFFLVDSDRYEINQKKVIEKKFQEWEDNKENFPFLPNPKQIFLEEPLLKDFDSLSCLHFLRLSHLDQKTTIHFKVEEEKNFFGNLTLFKEQVSHWLKEKYIIYISTESPAQKERIHYLFKEFPIEVIIGSFSHSFIWQDERIVLITEKELLGKSRKNTSSSWKDSSSQIIDSFSHLEEGSYIVHLQHGIGVFKSIERKILAGIERDYIRLEYANKEILLVPIEQVNLIQQYIHSGSHVSLDSIGSKSWERRKSKAKKRADDIAQHLISLYSQRQKTQGFSFKRDDEWQLAFDSAFPYEETPDQKKAIQEIKADMESIKPMDRLLCGDVGFGKTEVAIRACFKAVMSGKQVAVLAPTTILAEQHYENFCERFMNFPISISLISRFTENKIQKEVLENLSVGKIDIIIGTHRILSDDVQFSNLGLLVIDEEQRFGVKAKEKLKEKRINLDILTLSATPIPRTLHTSLVKLRDISTLATPPINRKEIETFIVPFSEEIIQKAISQELERNGQVFFLHNRIETLKTFKTFIETLFPQVTAEIIHGQMPGEQLESIMHRFTHNHFQVLVSTTIIENGIDIPNANTIIINNSHLYGLAQLYQLKGRVGRRGEKAFAYLLYPENTVLSEYAIKRLEVLNENTSLGSGFKIAMRDLEIRGMGNLLGSEQSGEIESVGLDMYLRLLEESVAQQLNTEDSILEPYLDLGYQGFIPNDYISNSHEKMEIYKKLAGLKTEEEISTLRDLIYNRFGSLPLSIEPFFLIAELKIISRYLRISSIVEKDDSVRISFLKADDIPINKIMEAFQKNPQLIILSPNELLSFSIRLEKRKNLEKLSFLIEKLSSFLD